MSKLILPNSSLENIKMVIFDKDGTLIDVHHYWCSMIEFRAEAFVLSIGNKKNKKLYNELVNAMGIDLNSKKMKPEGPVGIKPREFIMDVALEVMNKYDKNYTKERVIKIFEEVDDYSQTQLKNIVKALSGVENILVKLKEEKIKVSIATTDLTKRAVLAMQTLRLEEYFDEIAGADLVEKAKPNADLVLYLLKKYGLDKKEVVVIGDSMADLGMANSANCQFIGVRTGLYNETFLEKSQYLVETLNDIKVEK